MKQKTLLVLALAGPVLAGPMLTGCMRSDDSRGDGWLELALAADGSVDEVTATRAALPGLTLPTENEFALHVERTDAEGEWDWADFTESPERLPLLAGGYTATASYGNPEAEGFGVPCFSATESFTIVHEQLKTVAMTARLSNMALTVDYTDAFKSYFPDYSATVSRGSTEIVEFAKGETRTAFLKPQAFGIRVDYTKPSDGGAGYSTYNVAERIGAANLLRVVFDVNGGGVGTAVITISFNGVEEVVLDPIEVGQTEQ